jgi:hypothetical protein
VGRYCLTHLLVSNSFDIVLIVVDHLARMAHFLPCTESATFEETADLFVQHLTYDMDSLECWLVTATRNSSAAFGRRFGDA